MTRRLPVYLLVETSSKMLSKGADDIKATIHALHSDLMGDPSASESVWLSVIGFSDEVLQLCPLTEVFEFVPPVLSFSGGAALGHAILFLRNLITKEVHCAGPGSKGDWKPMVFLLTEGNPTGEWHEPLQSLRNALPNLVAIHVGEADRTSVLEKAGLPMIRAGEMSANWVAQFFKWASSSVASEADTSFASEAEQSARTLTKPVATPGPIHRETSIANDDSLLQLVRAGGASAAAKDARGNTPLHLAASLGLTQWVRPLLKIGALLDHRNNDGDTPLLVALRHGHHAVARELLACGARGDLVNALGESALHMLLLGAAETDFSPPPPPQITILT